MPHIRVQPLDIQLRYDKDECKGSQIRRQCLGLVYAIFGMFKYRQLFKGHKVCAAVDEAVSAPQEVLCT